MSYGYESRVWHPSGGGHNMRIEKYGDTAARRSVWIGTSNDERPSHGGHFGPEQVREIIEYIGGSTEMLTALSGDTVDKTVLVKTTLDWPHGCEDMKRQFLKALGIERPEDFLPKPVLVTFDGGVTYSDGSLDALSGYALDVAWSEFGLRMPTSGDLHEDRQWRHFTAELMDGARFWEVLNPSGLGVVEREFEQPAGWTLRIRANVDLAAV